MKLVIDTNVVVSGIYFGGVPKVLLETVVDNNYQIILSEDIVFEYLDVIDRMSKKKKSDDTITRQVLNTLIDNANMLVASGIITPPCEDPQDIKLFASSHCRQGRIFNFRGQTFA